MPTFTSRQVAATQQVTFQAGTLIYVGCSNTDDSVDGYQDQHPPVAAGAFCPHYPTGGGSLYVWAEGDPDLYRGIFETQWAANSGEAVWWQQCIRNGEGGTTDYTGLAETIADWLVGFVGTTVPIWVSPLNTYAQPDPGDPPQVVSAAVHEAVRDATVDYMTQTLGAMALPGPTLGPLESDMTSDGTHPNANGRALFKLQLMEFFDGKVV